MADLQQRQGMALLLALAIAGGGWWWFVRSRPPDLPLPPVAVAPPANDSAAPPAVVPPAIISVTIEGEVRSPGCYQLPAGSTLRAALARAGGLTDAARSAALTLEVPLHADTTIYVPPQLLPGRFTATAPLTDRDLLHLPRRHAVPASGNTPERAAANSVAAGDQINLNTVTREQLLILPRIGPKTADAILEYRAKVGRLRSLDELRNIPRIGDKTLAALRDRVTL